MVIGSTGPNSHHRSTHCTTDERVLMKVKRVPHHPLLHLGIGEHANESSPGFVGDGLSEAENEQF